MQRAGYLDYQRRDELQSGCLAQCGVRHMKHRAGVCLCLWLRKCHIVWHLDSFIEGTLGYICLSFSVSLSYFLFSHFLSFSVSLLSFSLFLPYFLFFQFVFLSVFLFQSCVFLLPAPPYLPDWRGHGSWNQSEYKIKGQVCPWKKVFLHNRISVTK